MRRTETNTARLGASIPEKQQWLDALSSSKIVAAVRGADVLPLALESPVRIVYLLFGSPLNITEMIAAIRERGKLPLANLDLLQGLSRDPDAVEYLARAGAAGIISTHLESLRSARMHGLITVLRTFVIDSAAVLAGLRSLDRFEPDAVELLPAIAAPLVLSRIREGRPALPVIAGGLVTDLRQAEQLIAAGIDSISLSDPKLWVV